jgi:glucosyl-dolichyl phosphate glucuronosyltransferase
LSKSFVREPGARDAAHPVSATPAPILMSVVVGTLNRAALLTRAIDSLLRQHAATTELEIIVVDNGSTDDTARVVAEKAEAAPHLRYVQEPRLGLSFARNRGIEHSTGSIVAFLDDDAEADPEWADRLAALFREDAAIGAAGGKTLVRWPVERPEWVTANIESYYGKCDYGDARRPLTFPEYPFGSNMAIRRQWLDRLEGFRTDLGARGGNLMAGEETDLFERLNGFAVRIAYEPSAIVHHWAAPERLSRRWCLRRAFRHGQSSALMDHTRPEPQRGSISRNVRRALGRASIGGVSTCIAAITNRPPAIVMSRATHTAYWMGFFRGVLKRGPTR